MSDDGERLEQLVRGWNSCISITTYEEEYALGLVRDTALAIGCDLKLWSVTEGVRDGLFSDAGPVKDTENPAAGLYYLWRQDDAGMCVTLDLADHLGDARTLRVLRSLIQGFSKDERCLVMIDHTEAVPTVIQAHATQFELSLPGEKELEAILRRTLQRHNREEHIDVHIRRRELGVILRNLRGLTRREVEQILAEAVADDRRFDAEDLNLILARKRQAIRSHGLLEYVEAPVDLAEIGGLRRLKQWLAQREHAMMGTVPEPGITAPRGVLMLGVQGAGKSMCAKAIATAWQRPLLRMDVGALYDRYVGESERRLRDALRQADAMAPIILWIDEIEKAFASAASRSTDGGLSQRMFGSLLTWMQEHRDPVFLVATANDIEALPPELLRKGRFDEIFFVDLPAEETRRQILAIHLQKRKRDPEAFDLDALVKASEGYSGAEIEQAILTALHEAYAEKTELTTQHVADALDRSPPLSVIMAERVAALRRWAEGRCVPAD